LLASRVANDDGAEEEVVTRNLPMPSFRADVTPSPGAIPPSFSLFRRRGLRALGRSSEAFFWLLTNLAG